MAGQRCEEALAFRGTRRKRALRAPGSGGRYRTRAEGSPAPADRAAPPRAGVGGGTGPQCAVPRRRFPRMDGPGPKARRFAAHPRPLRPGARVGERPLVPEARRRRSRGECHAGAPVETPLRSRAPGVRRTGHPRLSGGGAKSRRAQGGLDGRAGGLPRDLRLLQDGHVRGPGTDAPGGRDPSPRAAARGRRTEDRRERRRRRRRAERPAPERGSARREARRPAGSARPVHCGGRRLQSTARHRSGPEGRERPGDPRPSGHRQEPDDHQHDRRPPRGRQARPLREREDRRPGCGQEAARRLRPRRLLSRSPQRTRTQAVGVRAVEEVGGRVGRFPATRGRRVPLRRTRTEA